MRKPCIPHYGGDIGKIEVNQAGNVDQLGNALHTAAQHIVCNQEGVEQGNIRFGSGAQALVGDDDKRIDIFLQLCNALFRKAHTALAFKIKRLCNDGDRQNAHVFCNFCDYGRGTGACPAAHTGGDKNHIRALNGFADILGALFRCLCACLRVCAGAHAFCGFIADIDLGCGAGIGKRLQIGVDCDKFNTLDISLDHAVDGVVSAAADTNDFNIDNTRAGIGQFKCGHTMNPPVSIKCVLRTGSVQANY